MANTSRRSFSKKSAITMAGAGLYLSMPNRLYGSNAPSDRINIGVVGMGFGVTDMRYMLEGNKSVHCVALCDVDQIRLEAQNKFLKERFPDNAGNIKFYSDFRKLLEDKNIDGVIIAPPEHWHAYIYAEACKAGKAIYIEKATGHTVSECNLMVDLQSKYKNVVTTGLWQVSLEYFTEAFNILKTGVLGDLYKVHAWINGGTNPTIFSTAPQTIPGTLDYNMWLGPAPQRPYASERLHGNWRRFWDYGGGGQAEWTHHLDSAFDGLAALGHERTYPKSIYSVGYKHPKTMYEVPALQTSVFEFDDYHLVWEHQVSPLYNRGDGVAWIGSNGTLVCNRTGYELIPVMSGGKPLIEATKKQGPYANQRNHMANWAECIRNNNLKTNCPIEKGSYASELAHIANISYRLGGIRLEYNHSDQKFLNNPEADSYIYPKYQNNWKYPQV